jgi:PKD repeat protein
LVVTHTYAAGATYTATLIVATAGGVTASTNVTVVTPNRPPTASFTIACEGLTCIFNAALSSDPDGRITAYAWDFGDGTTGAGIDPTHVYSWQGTYMVHLVVTDNGGASSAQDKSIKITRSPHRR